MEHFIKQLPKAELHLHIEGTFEPKLVFAIASRNGITLPYQTVADLTAAYNFHDLQSFLDLYYGCMQVLQQEQDFYDLTWAYLIRAKKNNILHAEIFCDPQAHTSRGVPMSHVIHGIYRALLDGKDKLNITSHLIPCILRDHTVESAMKTVAELLQYKNAIKGLGLCSAELNYPPEKFVDVFALAREHGWLTVAHAGEEGPADYIWQALKLLKVKRIDHGVRCVEDPKLVEYLKDQQIPLTMCPLSNIKLHVYKDLSEHPVKSLLTKGLCVTINSDDPAYFGGYINQNFIETATAHNLSQDEVVQLARNSFVASFIEDNLLSAYLEQLNQARLK